MTKYFFRIFFGFLFVYGFCSCGESKKNNTDAHKKDTVSREMNINQIVGVASIEPKSHILALYSETGGVVKKIDHDINEDVKANDIIVELVSDVEQSQLEQSESKLATQEGYKKYCPAIPVGLLGISHGLATRILFELP